MGKPKKEVLEAHVRTEFGKGASRRDRRAGFVPAVLYGHGNDPQHLNLPAHDLAAIFRHSGVNAVMDLLIEGDKQLALTKQITMHPVRRYIEHVDLLVVRRGEKVVIEVPVILEGTPAPGTTVNQDANVLEVQAEPLNIPENITVSIEGLEIGDQILASQVSLPGGVELIGDPESLVVNITEIEEADLGDEEGEETGEEGAEGEDSGDQEDSQESSEGEE